MTDGIVETVLVYIAVVLTAIFFVLLTFNKRL